VHQARAEARAEAEAAAEQRLAAALAHERAELGKQVRLMLFMRQSTVLRCSGLVAQSVDASDGGCDGCTRQCGCGSMGHGVMELSWRQALVFAQCVYALLTVRYSLPRCSKRAPRRALRRRQQPSSALPRH